MTVPKTPSAIAAGRIDMQPYFAAPKFFSIFRSALDFIFPRTCAGCGSLDDDLCKNCEAAISRAAPLEGRRTGLKIPLIALGTYEGTLRAAVIALKFNGARVAGRRLGAMLAAHVPQHRTMIVPVPLHPRRLRERGYNQAMEIALGIASVTGADIAAYALRRIKSTLPQSKLDAQARAHNVSGAFAAGPDIHLVHGRELLIVDDVVTTGATSDASARVLLDSGATSVYLAAVAARL
jgi:ComF family protein